MTESADRPGRPAWRRHLERWLPFAIVVALVPVVVWDGRLIGDFRVDDAYITFAFSKNLAEGHGPIYGHDMVVEGYSNFLWMVVGAIAHVATPGDVLLGVRVAGFACLAGLVVSVVRLARLHAGWACGIAAAVAVALCTDGTRATLSGLETVPFAAAIAGGFLVHLQELGGDPERRRPWRWSALAFVPAALLRIDGFLPLLYILAFELLEEARGHLAATSPGVTPRERLMRYLRWAVPALALVGAYWIWRASYYGLLLPTTYYAKSGVTDGNAYRGVDYLVDGIRALGWLPPLVLAGVALGRRPGRAVYCLFGFVVCHLAYVVKVGGDWMPFSRFLLPVLGLVMVLGAWGAQALLDEVRREALLFKAGVAAMLVALLGFVLVFENAHQVMSAQESAKLGNAAHVRQHTRGLLDAAPFMVALQRKPGEVLVTDYGGVFAYYGDARVIEMWGLCNRRIALEGTTKGINAVYGKTCIPCYRDFDPDYFHVNQPMVRHRGAFRSHGQVVGAIFQHKALNRVLRFRKNYVVGRVTERATGRALFFLEKRRDDVALVRRDVGRFVVDYPFVR